MTKDYMVVTISLKDYTALFGAIGRLQGTLLGASEELPIARRERINRLISETTNVTDGIEVIKVENMEKL